MPDSGLDHQVVKVRPRGHPPIGLNALVPCRLKFPLREKGRPLPVRTAIVRAPVGLHARPAARFVRAVLATGLPVTISRDGRPGVDARSLLEVMTEDFRFGCTVKLSVADESLPHQRSAADVEQALDSLRDLVESSLPG